ncbi:MAG: Ig-like domain-containing protein [Candidatus Eremiobacteraeota bacterium]|nr:Ig-like domain-containing protein [Candidatus Eremiobacteraeota bacterium]
MSWGVVIAAAVAACAGPAPSARRLAPVAAIGRPALPPWIASISPIGSAENLAQIRVIFGKPVAPVTALSGAGPRDVLSHLRIEPDLAGHFTLLTPRMIGFVADQALPLGTRVRVTLTAGLRDLDGDALAHDLAWTFETAPLELTNLPQLAATADDESTPPPADLHPTLEVTANAATDASSLAEHAALIGGGERIGVSASLRAQPTPYPGANAQELFDPSLKTWIYRLRPTRELRRGTKYTLQIAPGVAPAYGNLPTTQRFDGAIRTYDALAIVPAPSASPNSGGRFADGDPAITFTNPLDPKSVTDAVKISPAPASVKTLISVPDKSNVIAIDPYALDPDATYTATVAASVKDVFGQTLGQEQRVTIRTSDFAPGAWAPTGTNVIPAGAPVALNFYATNLPKNGYQAAYAGISPLKLLGNPGALAMLPPPNQWPEHTIGGARRNVQGVVRIPLRAQMGGEYGALAYGFRTALDAPNSSPWLTGIAQLTSLGVFAQWFPSRGIVLVQHLGDGAPVDRATVALYRIDEENKVPPTQCATGTTNAGGELDVSGVDVERCSAGATENQAPNLGVVVTQGSDVATVSVWNYSGISRFDVSGGWTSGAPLSRGTIFTDRQMYQPGERGELTGIAYYVKGSQVVADADARYSVKLVDPNNNESPLGQVQTDALGVFSMPITFAKQQPLGYYTVDAKGANGNDISGSLRVAEFKPPNFKLTLTLGAKSATAGSSVHASAAAAYLFGAPLEGGSAHAYVTRDLAMLQPKGWDEFSFGPQWFWPEETPSFDTDVLQRDLPLDKSGNAALDVTVPRDLPFPMTYRVDMETTDVSNLSVADSATFLALPADAIIGLASDTVGSAGKPMPIRAIVTDADGKPIAGRAVHLELQKMTYTSATEEVEGGESAQQAIKYDTVASADITSGDKPVTAALTPSDVGPYRVRASFDSAQNDKDGRGSASATDVQVFAFGTGEADWGLADSNAVAVKLDKKQYSIGDTASALVASPYDRADVYLAVVRGDVIYRTTLHDVHDAVHVNFKVTPEMLPNAALEAVVVRRGPHGAKGPDTLALTGMAGFTVDVASRYLKLGITARNATVTPGGTQHLDFSVTSKNGAPATGDVVAMVVNDAILQLSGYRLPDLVQTVFAAQPIATIFADNRENVTLKTQTPPLEKGYGYGGGFLAGAAGTRVRTKFRPLAYYRVLKTDARGRAGADFTMPDDLTTWRVMAVALAQDRGHFATADSTFVSSQPLIANPLLPQFARPGDRFDLGVSIANQTGAGGVLDLVLELTGALAFAQGDPQKQRATENAVAGMQAYRFPVNVGTPGPTKVQAEAALGTQRDAFKVPFAPSDRGATDSVIESGVTRNEASIPVALGSGGSLQVTLANSVVPQFVVPSERAMMSEGLPFADDAASRLVIASALADLRGPYRLTLAFDPTGAIGTNLERLRGLQRGDGGFGVFADASESDPFTTASALEALTFARKLGVAIDPTTVGKASDFMAQVLANPGRFKWCSTDQLCKARLRFEALWSLAAAGRPRTDFLPEIVAQFDRFDSATQIRLARYLLRTAGWQNQGVAFADRLQQTLYVTGRYATANPSTRWSFAGSLVDAQAQMLHLLIERHAPPELLDGAVRALVAQQCKCGWPTIDDTASALIALAAYASTEVLAPATATAAVGDQTIGTVRFGATASTQTFTLPVASLHGNAVVVKTNAGSVHFTLLYTYPVPNDAPGELAAFRVIRTLSNPSGQGAATAALATMDLVPSQPVDVSAGRVFDVGVRTIVDHPVDRIVIEDPLPAGFEAVDTAFRTALQAVVPQSNSWEIDTSQIYRDRVIAYAQHLDPGVYELHYLVRSVTPGTFAWPGSRAYLRDAPEQFGRAAASTLHVQP